MFGFQRFRQTTWRAKHRYCSGISASRFAHSKSSPPMLLTYEMVNATGFYALNTTGQALRQNILHHMPRLGVSLIDLLLSAVRCIVTFAFGYREFLLFYHNLHITKAQLKPLEKLIATVPCFPMTVKSFLCEPFSLQ